VLLDVGTRQPGGPAAPWQGPNEKEIKNTKQSKDGGRKTGQSISYKSGQFYLLSTILRSRALTLSMALVV
jgi:hypothetical protein